MTPLQLRTTALALALIAGGAAGAGRLSAQSIERRVLAGDGAVQFVFAAREGVCGDGARFIEDGFGGEGRIYENGSTFNRGRDELWPSCIAGPVRVVASVTNGEIVRLRTYAGPVRSTPTSVRDLGVVPVGDAAAFLTRLIEGDNGRVGEQAVLPSCSPTASRPGRHFFGLPATTSCHVAAAAT